MRNVGRGCGRRLAFYLFPAVLLVGCGFSPRAQKAHEEKGREIARQNLQAWREGKTIDSLKPVTIVEPRWQAGNTLENFAISDSIPDSEYQYRCKVELQLKNNQGKPVREVAEYVITTSPAVTMIRGSEGW